MTDHLPGFDSNVPAASRRYNYLLGGKDNFASDRASASGLAGILPQLPTGVAENRKLVLRTVRYLAADLGLRQFLDIGSGMPLSPMVHEVAQMVASDARVVYVDNDPLVAVHCRALCTSSPHGRVEFQDGDLLDPDAILHGDVLRATVDLKRPVAVLLCAVLHFEPDDVPVYSAVRRLVGALPSGSAVVLTHATFDPLDTVPEVGAGHGRFRARTAAEVAAFLDGLELIPPGLVPTIRWHPELEPAPASHLTDADAICYAAVARIP